MMGSTSDGKGEMMAFTRINRERGMMHFDRKKSRPLPLMMESSNHPSNINSYTSPVVWRVLIKNCYEETSLEQAPCKMMVNHHHEGTTTITATTIIIITTATATVAATVTSTIATVS
jgi:hypothetical protein